MPIHRCATFLIPALDCPEELRLIRAGLERLPGVIEITPIYLRRSLMVTYDPSRVEQHGLAQRLREIGFAPQSVADSPATESQEPLAGHRAWAVLDRRTILTMLGALLLIVAALWQFAESGNAGPRVLAVLSALVGGIPVLAAAARALRLRRIDMNVLMSLAAIGALLNAPRSGEWFEAPTAVLLFGVSLWLERSAMDRARRAVESLLMLHPAIAHRRGSDHQLQDVAVDQIVAGDRILVLPGERFPTDGVVEQGDSWINNSAITGESTPVDARPGSSVRSGSLNGEGVLELRVTHPAAESTLANIARLIEQAQSRRSETERFVDRFARWYTPVVVALAVVIATLPWLAAGISLTASPGLSLEAWNLEAASRWDWLHRGLVLLVIACPCALVLSTPLTIVCGLRQAARSGILVKGGASLEAAGKLTAVAFDKTGTLTQARLRVVSTHPRPGITSDFLLSVAASLESRSEHPIAQAIVQHARNSNIDLRAVADSMVLRGSGVQGTIDGMIYRATNRPALDLWLRESTGNNAEDGENRTAMEPDPQGDTVIWIGSQSRVLGAVVLSDAVREDARDALDQLRRRGIQKLFMLTGDRAESAQRVAQQLGIDEFQAGLLPDQKLDAVVRLRDKFPMLAMVGDGVNDGPALAAARVGIALGAEASDTAMETADVVILAPQLDKLAQLIDLSRTTRTLLWQNVILALTIKAIVFGLAAVGQGTLWLAVAADVGASLLVIFNGMRILNSDARN
jgi:Cd2+/Zn2+-exporting ATPase